MSLAQGLAREADRPVSARKIARLSRPNASEARSSTVRGRGRSTNRSAAMRPGRGVITTTRSARNTASGIEWVTNTMVLRASRGSGGPRPRCAAARGSSRRASSRRARRTARPSAGAADRAAARGRARRAAACRPTARAAACRRSRSGRPARAAARARASRSAGVEAGQLGRQQHVVEDRCATSAAPAPGRPCRRRRIGRAHRGAVDRHRARRWPAAARR